MVLTLFNSKHVVIREINNLFLILNLLIFYNTLKNYLQVIQDQQFLQILKIKLGLENSIKYDLKKFITFWSE